MTILRTPNALKTALRSEKRTVGFVPTMGALHSGHRRLIESAQSENDIVVVSIFVNPTQFLEGEDLEHYPRRVEADEKICELSGVDYLFYPEAASIYGKDEVAVSAPNVRGYILEGTSRPGHFNGVLTVVMKLLNIVNPTRAYFGKKDAQQLMLIQEMVKHFFMDVEIIPMDTVREEDGLALSSRNIYLSGDERKEAQKIVISLKRAGKLVMQNILESDRILVEMYAVLEPLEVEHIAIVNRAFEPIERVEVGNTIILVEAVVGKTRLLDNIWI
ncbi:MAG: pantoate--beta-alanine ligase [Epsilonproteobacteria bacterium]|nr:MAG: pantoate--beta-alanine ligase [Campylobacterota bacterium]